MQTIPSPQPISIVFVAPIAPRGKDRPRSRIITSKTGRSFSQTYTPPATRRWEELLSAYAEQHLPDQILEGPLAVDIFAVLPRPKRLMRKKDPDGLIWHPGHPDLDNIRKATLDALSAFWRDDSQVCYGQEFKAYAEKTGRARLGVRIYTNLDQADVIFRQFDTPTNTAGEQ